MSTIDFATEQRTIKVDDREYLVTAMPASVGLKWLEKHQDEVDSGKFNNALMREVITMWVSFENKPIDQKRFDVIFSRKYVHMKKLYKEILNFNFEELFQSPDSEED